MSAARVRRSGAAALVLAVLVPVSSVLAGCGVTSQDRPSRIERDEVPFGLLREPSSTPELEPASTDTGTTLPG